MKSIKLPLFFGAGYFLFVAIAHATNLKIPGLFIYFNVPAYTYQDQIISFLAFGWSVCFFTAARTLAKALIEAIIFMGALALIMLFYINLNTDFAVFSTKINPSLFNLETGILLLYWIWLFRGYQKSKLILITIHKSTNGRIG
ncbi:hypothetical protein L0128_06390 [candidate division KSB1 bacterium]|jgi:hypothetical protein|nr:hypothetical protein [candidate division KSB1 bacterium]